MSRKKTFFTQEIITILQKIEDGILIGLLLSMIGMAVLQIIMRNLFDSGILWGDEFIRVLVLWIGLIGAMIASRNNHHISIDLISRYFSDRIKKQVTLIIFIFTALICVAMTYFSLGFVMMEKKDGFIAFANIPTWVCESIIPIAFAIISLRYMMFSFTGFIKLFKRIPQ